MNTFEKNLFDALRVLSVDINDGAFLCDEEMVKAIKINDLIVKNYHLTMKPQDIVLVAKNKQSEAVLEKLNSFFEIDEKMKKAKPMYLPEEVLNIDEATFRFHQLVHYFSTYGLEELFGVETRTGWLPNPELEIPTEESDALLETESFEIVKAGAEYLYLYKKIVTKRNRASRLETELLEEAVKHLSVEELCQYKVVFKENLFVIFSCLMNSLSGKERIMVLSNICQNPTDVFKCAKKYLNEKRYHFTTSQKRAIVCILESYSSASFRENLMMSNKRREENLIVLQYVDYNRYSKSKEHLECVKLLRNDDLASWEARLKNALSKKNFEVAVQLLKQRPGLVVRFANWLLKEGLSKQQIIDILRENKASLSLQTLLENINTFSNDNIKENLAEKRKDVLEIFTTILKDRLLQINTRIKNKKVFIDAGQYDFRHSQISFNSASSESGYIKSGIAFKIPDEVNYLRTFVYWENDIHGNRVDVDAHFRVNTVENEEIHLGWNDDFRKEGCYFSGDVTSSVPYGCEYLDIDLSNPKLDYAVVHINSFTGQFFKNIQNFKVGMMAIGKLKDKNNKSLYNNKNCFFVHELKGDFITMNYAFIDFKNRYLKFLGSNSNTRYGSLEEYASYKTYYSLPDFLNDLCDSQQATIVSSPEDADFILRLDKGLSDNEISLIDVNFFVDEKQ